LSCNGVLFIFAYLLSLWSVNIWKIKIVSYSSSFLGVQHKVGIQQMFAENEGNNGLRIGMSIEVFIWINQVFISNLYQNFSNCCAIY
jgi:hypothetical protein